jgi:hypothetical protein
MFAGMNQEIEVLGRVLHVQTEVSTDVGLVIRTAVFIGGKVVARRDRRLDERAQEAGAKAVRSMMTEQHRAMIDNIVGRAERYQERKREGAITRPGADEPSAVAVQAGGDDLPRPPRLPAELEPALQRSLRIRGAFARFRHRIKAFGFVQDLGVRLRSAAGEISSIVTSDEFREIRIDEQVHFHLIKEQNDAWLETGGDADQGSQLWADLLSFADHLWEINNRAELIAFDGRRLSWALAAVERGESLTEALTSLRPVYGRHPQLDGFLDYPEGRSDEQWIEVLRKALAEIQGGAAVDG